MQEEVKYLNQETINIIRSSIHIRKYLYFLNFN